MFQFHLLSLSRWSSHLPQCQSTSVSVALVSTRLATVSVHFCLSMSPWSPHGLPQCQSTASSSVSVTVRVVIPTAPLSAYRRHSQNSCSYLLPQGLNPNPLVNTCLHDSHYNNFLSGFAVRIECDRARVDFLPQLGLPVNSRGGGPRSLGESQIGRLVLPVETACTCWTLIACQLLRWVAVLSAHCV